MALIEVTFDTKEKTLVASIEGKPMADVSEVWFMGFSDGKGSVEFKTVEIEENESYFKVTRIYANADGEDVIDESRQDANAVDIKELGQVLLKRPLA